MSSAAPIPDISWRLVMHPLTIVDRLLLSRCSSSLMRAACSPFAWRGVTLDIDTSAAERLARLNEGRVLRHIPLSLSIHSLTTFAQLCALLSGALSRSVLRALDARECSTELAWTHILAQPQMEHLTVLYLSGLNRRALVSAEMAQIIAALPALEILHMAADALPMLRHSADRLPASFASLRSLQLHATWPALSHDLQPHPLRTAFCAHCPNQTELSLQSPPLTEHTFLPTFMEPHMPRIQRLCLIRLRSNHYQHPGIVESEVPLALANMQCMRTIVFDRCDDCALWMRHLQHAPTLELLEITSRDPGRSEDLLSEAAIAAMMHACHRLRFRWTLEPPSDRMAAAERKHWLAEKDRYRQSQSLVPFGPRFMMLDCDADLDTTVYSPDVGQRIAKLRKKTKCVVQ